MDKIEKVSVNGQVYELAGSGGGGSAITSITYAELKELAESSDLVPESRYRITDFVSTFNESQGVKSAGHAFDLIVTANTESSFYPKAMAAKHEGDEYFANNDLSKWEIWYDFFNDTGKYNYALSTGKGFIYRMIDEYNNDVNYDFKNLLMGIGSNYFHSFSEASDDIAYFYTFSSAKSTSTTDLKAVSDLSVESPEACKNNKIIIEYERCNNGVAMILGVVDDGVIKKSYKISDNYIKGYAVLFSSGGITSGSIVENTICGSFTMGVFSNNSITGNKILNAKVRIGPQNWEQSTYNIILGRISNNTFLSGIYVFGQETDSLSFSNNLIRQTGNTNRILAKANIERCEITGVFNSSGVEILEEQSYKMIIGNDTSAIIVDPVTFFQQ